MPPHKEARKWLICGLWRTSNDRGATLQYVNLKCWTSLLRPRLVADCSSSEQPWVVLVPPPSSPPARGHTWSPTQSNQHTQTHTHTHTHGGPCNPNQTLHDLSSLVGLRAGATNCHVLATDIGTLNTSSNRQLLYTARGQGAPIDISVVIPNVSANLCKLVENYANICIEPLQKFLCSETSRLAGLNHSAWGLVPCLSV